MGAGVGRTAMSDEHTRDETKTPDLNRRTILKGIGTAAGAGIAGIGFSMPALAADAGPTVSREEVSVSQSTVEDALEQRASRIVLAEASIGSLDKADATKYTTTVDTDGDSRAFQTVVVPSADGDSKFSYVASRDGSDRTATVKTSDETLIRATSVDAESQTQDTGLRTEKLKLGKDVTTNAIQSLKRSDKKDIIMQNGIGALQTDQASAYTDLTTGSTHLFVPAEMDTGKTGLLLVEMNANGELDSIRAMPQGAVDCFATCLATRGLSLGPFCAPACSLCISVPTIPSCTPCLACAGAIAGSCAIQCGAQAILS